MEESRADKVAGALHRVRVELDITPEQWTATPLVMGAGIAAAIEDGGATEVRATRRELTLFVMLSREDTIYPQALEARRLELRDKVRRAMLAASLHDGCVSRVQAPPPPTCDCAKLGIACIHFAVRAAAAAAAATTPDDGQDGP